MTERQKTMTALAVLSAAIGVYAEINYQAKLRSGEITEDSARGAAATPTIASAPSASASAAHPPSGSSARNELRGLE